MKETQERRLNLRSFAGSPVLDFIAAGPSGDATLHSKGFVVGDPCYLLGHPTYEAFLETRFETRKDTGLDSFISRWTELEFQGRKCLMRDTGDGYRYGHLVDSGWIAAIPRDLCSAEAQKNLNRAEREAKKNGAPNGKPARGRKDFTGLSKEARANLAGFTNDLGAMLKEMAKASRTTRQPAVKSA
jgi:hypothetical protein